MSISLRDFVEQTLLDITNAVYEAQSKAPLWIAPGYVEGQKQISPQMIEFSVQVTASEENQQNGKGELSMPIITIVKASVSGTAGYSMESQITQSLKFSVPVYFQSRKL